MKYCSHCGNELFENAVVCVKCGCQVRDFSQNSAEQQPTQTVTAQPKTRKLNPLCLVGFILSFIIPLVGLICSCIGKSQVTQNPNEDGETYAKAGIIISAVRMGLNVALTAFWTLYGLIFLGIIVG